MSNKNLIDCIDIIMPNYNKGFFLEESIKSVLDQSYENWFLYIIDDNSFDSSKKIIKSFDEKNKNIKTFFLNKNKGPGFCRNYGMRVSSSKYIAFIDSDDIWLKNKLETQLKFMKKNDLEFSYSDYVPFIQKGNDRKMLNRTNLKNRFGFSEFILNSSINSSTMIILRKIINNLKFKNIKKLEDYLFKCQILKKGFVAFKVNDSLAYYRISDGSRSSSKIKNIVYLWNINKKYNKLNFFKNFLSICMIAMNSLKKYGLK